MKKLLMIMLAALPAWAFAVPKIRLVYGKDWSRAGREVKKTLESSAFKSAAKGKFTVECIDWDEAKKARGYMKTLKLPAIFVISEQGNCFFVRENVPSYASGEQLFALVSRADKARQKAEKDGFDTLDKCGKFLERMEKFVGGPQRVISEGFYPNIFDKIVQMDPADKEGWQRHFRMGDGIDIVIKANEFREKKDVYGGEKFIQDEFSKPRKHLTREQQQALLMAKFALYRENPAKKEELKKMLTGIGELGGEDTLWGTSALGWLNIMGEPPLSVYWGWRQGDFKGPKLNTKIKYGVDSSFRNAGKYTISFTKESGVNLRIDGLALLAGDEVVAELKNPAVTGDTTSFDFDLKRSLKGKITAMVVKGTTDANGGTSGRIKIKRHVLRPRKSV